MNSYTQRAAYVVMRDIDAVKTLSADADYKYHSEERILISLQLLIAQYQLVERSDTAGRLRNFTPKKLRYTLVRIWQGHNIKPPRPPKAGTIQRKAAGVSHLWRPGSARLRPQYWRDIEGSADFRQQQDCSPAYGDGTMTTAALLPEVMAGLEQLGLLDDDGEAPDADRKAFERSPSAQQGRRDARLGEGVLTDVETASGPARLKSGTDATVAAATSTLLPDSLQSPESSERATTRHSAAVVSSNCTRDDVYSAPPGDGISFADASLCSRRIVDFLSLPLGVGTHESDSQELTKRDVMDFDQIGRQMSHLHVSIRKVIDRLFGTFRLPQSLDSLFEGHSAGPELQALYQRCWGEDWSQVFLSLCDLRFAFASDVVLALLGAFLYDCILQDGTPWQTFFKETLGFPDYLARSLPATRIAELVADLVLPHNAQQPAAHNFVHTVCAAAFDRLLATDYFENQADTHADRLAAKLCTILFPHINRLDNIATQMRPREAESAWQINSQPGVKGVIKQAIMLKMKLLEASFSEYHHTCFWPEHASPADPLDMHASVEAPQMAGYQVAFTLFPGTRATVAGSSTDVASLAEVIMQPRYS